MSINITPGEPAQNTPGECINCTIAGQPGIGGQPGAPGIGGQPGRCFQNGVEVPCSGFGFDISQSNTSTGGHSQNQCECDCGGFARPGLLKNNRGGVLTYNNPKTCVGIPGLVHCLGNGMRMSLTAHNKDVMGFILGSLAIAFLFGVVTHWRYTKGFTKRRRVFRILRKK